MKKALTLILAYSLFVFLTKHAQAQSTVLNMALLNTNIGTKICLSLKKN